MKLVEIYEEVLRQSVKEDILSRLTAPEMVEAIRNAAGTWRDCGLPGDHPKIYEPMSQERAESILRLIAERLGKPQMSYLDELKNISQEAGEKYMRIQKELESKAGGGE